MKNLCIMTLTLALIGSLAACGDELTDDDVVYLEEDGRLDREAYSAEDHDSHSSDAIEVGTTARGLAECTYEALGTFCHPDLDPNVCCYVGKAPFCFFAVCPIGYSAVCTGDHGGFDHACWIGQRRYCCPN